MTSGETADKALIALLKAIPNLESLVFDMDPPCSDDEEEDYVAGNNADGELNLDNKDDDWKLDLVTPGCLLVHLKSVCFKDFTGNPGEIKLVQLILKIAKALQTMTISSFHYSALGNRKSKELEAEITSLPRASTSCVFKFPSWHS
ncbi:uncharacterized protein LOC113309242 isoform X3 [Papaver somniferum]|uniref:uncharacterized protein LOC113309242 isoform X3 n=2 Tax=Papaver somniferum TaxID=3469 RepID=UPI000E6FD505|nr:uncharacterized protein LOC113309242 isoform X3 [Papaver somniferum]